MDSDNAPKAAATASAGTVTAMGAVATTMSAAEMTAALATIGFGSMGVGIAVAASIPLAVGGVAYGLWNLFSDY